MLITFATNYRLEIGFSTLVSRKRLNVEYDLRCVETKRNVKDLVSKKQYQPSH